MENQDYNNQNPQFSNLPDQPQWEEPKKSRWGTFLTLVVLIVLVIYFAGGWNWVSDGLAVDKGDEADSVLSDVTLTTGDEELAEVIGKVDNKQFGEVAAPGTADLTLAVSAAPMKEAAGKVEIRKVSLYNAFRKSWLVVYQGARPLDLSQLAKSGEKHQLITVDLLAMDYDKVLVEYKDSADQVKQAELAGVKLQAGKGNLVEIYFDLSGDQPELGIKN